MLYLFSLFDAQCSLYTQKFAKGKNGRAIRSKPSMYGEAGKIDTTLLNIQDTWKTIL